MLVLTEQCSCLLGPRLCCPPPCRPPPSPTAGSPWPLQSPHSTQHPCSPLLQLLPRPHRHTGVLHTCTNMYTCTHMDTDTGTHAMDMGTQTRVHMHTRAHPHTCTGKHRCKLTMCTCTNMHTDTRTRMDMDTCRHTRGHTHSLGRQPLHTLSLSKSWGFAPAYCPGTACSVSLGCSHGPSLHSDQATSLAQGKPGPRPGPDGSSRPQNPPVSRTSWSPAWRQGVAPAHSQPWRRRERGRPAVARGPGPSGAPLALPRHPTPLALGGPEFQTHSRDPLCRPQ